MFRDRLDFSAEIVEKTIINYLKDFSWLTERLCQIASDYCEGRLVSILEGGYDLEALAESVKAHVMKLCEA